MKNINLTQNEKHNNFKLVQISLDKFESFVNENISKTDLEINKIIFEEMLYAYKELIKIV